MKNNHLIIQWSRSCKLLWRHSDAYHPHIPTTALLSITSLELLWCNYTGEDDIRIWPRYSAFNTSVTRGARRMWPSLRQALWITQRVWSFRTWKWLQSDLLPWEMNFRTLQLIRRQAQPSIKKKKNKKREIFALGKVGNCSCPCEAASRSHQKWIQFSLAAREHLSWQ